ncbi:MAG: queuosine precursor transporter [Opitutaceae bacterium]|nr:queuosine precursor transporter [Opitutaceae bacterium]
MTDNPNPAVANGSPWRRFVTPVLSMAAVVLLSNVLVQYPINAWLTFGAFSYPLTYFVTDICNRWAGPALARRVAWAGFITGVASSFALHVPWRIAVASGVAFIVSQLLDIAVFNQLRKKSWWKAPLWGSSAASVIDTAIFFSIAFAGTELNWVHLGAGDLCVKLTMALVLLAPFRAMIGWLGLMPKKA